MSGNRGNGCDPVELLEQLARDLRWGRRWGSREKTHEESTLEHTVKLTTLAGMVLLLESKFGGTQFDAFKVLLATQVHEFGEAGPGDVTWKFKQDPLMKEMLTKIEREHFLGLLTLGPAEITEELTDIFDVQFDQSTAEGRLFSAIEGLGYLLFALYELRNGKEKFLSVLHNQIPNPQFQGALDEFVGVRMIFELIREEADSYLPKVPARSGK